MAFRGGVLSNDNAVALCLSCQITINGSAVPSSCSPRDVAAP